MKHTEEQNILDRISSVLHGGPRGREVCFDEPRPIIDELMNLVNDKQLIETESRMYRELCFLPKTEQEHAVISLYNALENFILSRKPPVVTDNFSHESLRAYIRKNVHIENCERELVFFLLPEDVQTLYLISWLVEDMAQEVILLVGQSEYRRIIGSLGRSSVSDDWMDIQHGRFQYEMLHMQAQQRSIDTVQSEELLDFFQRLYLVLFQVVERLLGRNAAHRIARRSYIDILEYYGSAVTALVVQRLPEGVLEYEKLFAFSSHELLQLNRELREKSSETEALNRDLERTKLATLNLLEDLEAEKRAVEQKVRERTKEIEEEKEKLVQVTSNMKGGGILLNQHGDVLFANRRVRELLNIPDSIPDHALMEVIHKTFEQTEVPQKLQTCRSAKDIAASTVIEAEGDGRIYEFYFHCLPGAWEDDAHAPAQFVLFTDITEAKQLEHSKSELVAVASHQLRTPLTAIRGNAELLLDESYGKLNKDQKELINDIETSTIRLIGMVNDMLDIAKIEKGELQFEIGEVDVVALVETVIAELNDYADRHEFTILHRHKGKELLFLTDKMRLQQVIQNLIDNAIKYSRHPGTLEITYRQTKNTLQITFSDNGIGIPKNEIKHIYDRFFRASNTSKTVSSGTGLGLPIVKSIVEQLGGSVRCNSEENVGTSFTITLPTSAQHEN